MTHTVLPRRGFLRALAAGAAGASLLSPLEAQAARVRSVAEGIGFRGDRQRSVAKLREAYLLDPAILYVNHASIGTIPRVVHEARVELLALCETNPWLYMWGGAWEGAREDARAALSDLLGADPAGLALTHNTTEGFNQLGNGLPLGEGDEVLFTDLNHVGATATWEYNARRRGFTTRSVPFPVREASEMSVEDVTRFHLDHISPRTRVLVFPHVDNMVGIRHDMRAIARGARAAGVEFIAVDAAQSAGMIPIDLTEAGVDAFSGSPHKWLQAAKGLGFLHLSPAARQAMEPSWVTWGQPRWADSARRFEDYGTRNLAEVVNLADAIGFQRALGDGEKDVRYRALRRWMYARVDATPGLTWRSPRSWDGGASLVAVEVAGRTAPELAAELYREHGVVLRAFGGALNALRISPHLTTGEEELERLFRLLEGATR